MRVKNKILLIILLVLVFNLFQLNIICAKQNNPERSYLLNTTWDQEGEYAKYTPDHWRLGCWSVAIAQILYYHRLQPHGYASYKCSTGYTIKEELNYNFNWNLFVNQLNADIPAKSKDEVAKYIYFGSVVLQKDFGTNTYVEDGNPHWLDEHYNCINNEYDTFKYSLDEIKSIIIKEIDSKRPVILYLQSLTGLRCSGY